MWGRTSLGNNNEREGLDSGVGLGRAESRGLRQSNWKAGHSPACCTRAVGFLWSWGAGPSSGPGAEMRGSRPQDRKVTHCFWLVWSVHSVIEVLWGWGQGPAAGLGTSWDIMGLGKGERIQGQVFKKKNILLLDLIIYLYVCFVYMYAACAWSPWRTEVGIRFLGTGVKYGCELPHRCSELNPGPL